ncbi:hypothetical protein I308_105792 [Cryptococcus tetragattii IND107]|uniref:Uncharacterized protein n=1 Tax=Cryptococcus tetragattii IND107 TaxID=1296105 RepID=A0ABR3BL50_9TREE
MTCNCFSEKTTSRGSTSKAQAKCTCQKGQCECEACPNFTKASGPGTCGGVKERLSTCGCNGSDLEHLRITATDLVKHAHVLPVNSFSSRASGQRLVELVAAKEQPHEDRALGMVDDEVWWFKKKSTPALAEDRVPPELIFHTSAL